MGGEEIGAREGGLLKWNGWAAEVRECALACREFSLPQGFLVAAGFAH